MTGTAEREGWGAARRGVGAVLLAVATLTVAWAGVVRVTADGRALAVHPPPAEGAAGPPATADTLRVLAWNIAHGRGDLVQGTLQNFRAGDAETRAARLAGIAGVIRGADADVVVLNEVDFRAAWSHGLNQAGALARATGYAARVEQRNFDYTLLFADFAFGNAVLTRLPVDGVRPVALPPRSRIEAALIGAKTAAVVALRTAAGPVAVVPIHFEFRDEDTRLAAVEPILELADHAPPLILAGDFNTAPHGWPRTDRPTAVDALLEAGWHSPRAARDPGRAALTFPSPDPAAAIDWVLAGPPLRVLDARVLTDRPTLSDHLPVLAVIEVRRTPAEVVPSSYGQ
ncbi:MAG: endonuclease/exonuclease/phosphatase family protein [Longimicrobiales bacterium]